MERVDSLGSRPGRLGAFTGAMLSNTEDPELQAIVEEAARILEAPAAAVSLVLEHIQFFRAQFGLAGDLAAARATDRDLSYCQFVVRDGAPFEVSDAEGDARVPREALRRFAARAYLGMPVRVGREVVGSLCVFDSRPRTFSAGDRAALARLADGASARLQQLARTQAARDARTELFHAASRSAFAELRNALGALSLEIGRARVAAAEAAPLSRVLLSQKSGGPAPELGWLQQSAAATEELEEALATVEDLAGRVTGQVVALQGAAASPAERVTLEAALDGACQLAHHLVKLVGGARWTSLPSVQLATPRPVAMAALAAALSAAAERMRSHESGGLWLDVELAPHAVRVWIDTRSEARAAATRDALLPLLTGELELRVLVDGARVAVELAR